MAWTTPPTFATGQLVTAAEMNALAADLSYLYSAIPTRAVIFHEQALVLLGNPLARVTSSAQLYGFDAYQNTPNNGDSFTNSFYLRDGTYTFTILGYTSTDCGKIDWYLDGS